MIRYLPYDQIDKAKWDACIQHSLNATAYADSWYLDRCAVHWDALVQGDYEAVFPLCWNKKWGIRYLYQPYFNQQGGLFSPHTITSSQLLSFVEQIPTHFRYIDINLNIGNHLEKGTWQVHPMVTHHLKLDQDLETIRESYKKNTKRNLAKARRGKVTLSTLDDAKALIRFFRANQGETFKKVSLQHYRQLESIIQFALEHGKGQIIQAVDTSGDLLAAAFFLEAHGQLINLLPSSTAQGRAANAMFLIIDHLIEAYAGKSLVLDFEGSVVPSIARFYQGFGGQPVGYQNLRSNRLPSWLRWMKN